ncbi:MAG: RluA family pseudouridine synthase [Spirochaetes bacterium]|nr:MAG: RluA family pseudouridine synthase [Spirochaetota bacterium]
MAIEHYEITVPEEYHLERADVFLASALEIDLSRSYVQKLIKGGHILANGAPFKANYKIKTGDILHIAIPEPETLDVVPENLPLDILYQDESIAVINKAAGMVVHPSPGNWNHTLVNALLFHLKDLSSIGGTLRPGIVHRLDKDTAGIMVVAKNDAAHQALTAEFAARGVDKRYIAVVVGKPKIAHELIEEPIARHPVYRHKMTVREDGREAVTELFCTKIWHAEQGVFSLFDVRLHTGRTHQIRVHLSSRGLPIVGDPIYSKKWDRYRVPFLLLASVFLEFTHPVKGGRMKFQIEPPVHITEFIRKLERNN